MTYLGWKQIGWDLSALPAAVVELLLKDNSTSLASGPWGDQT